MIQQRRAQQIQSHSINNPQQQDLITSLPTLTPPHHLPPRQPILIPPNQRLSKPPPETPIPGSKGYQSRGALL
ncbi:hypothetical protein BO82DRAFT_164254 [Aspergillus uvarum CBS 121591]|uniref:Uncharacterized protein n=1 Tax=Aspergillus uvarum CBS 121591 TaxID=1448315 RepID=A0A319CIT0_9EURO|nr:hypothetical protein BO82DRAFT_164254 [Aspergillus uvarum CBS 121591]PYH85616.1 hypothetical protein BO82DRAFT_164254 [Aspergillus uvarum CBS 121591]